MTSTGTGETQTAQRVPVAAGASGIGNTKALDEAAKDISGLKTVVCDVAKRDDIKRMVAASVEALGGLDVRREPSAATISNMCSRGAPRTSRP